ncbi:MAG: HAD family phosphatase [Candidatus Heimdallarchaeota archaeon]|nr:HAD family phosphatase [Candidatus Heimdallarchaeota archaeon]
MQRLIFIDVDGTLTTGLSTWEIVHHHFERTDPGIVAKMDENTALWEKGLIDYDTWAKLDVELWKGKPYQELHEALIPPSLIQGAIEGVAKLKSMGFYVILVSGGINIMVDEVKRLIGADEAFSNKICEKDGIITGEGYTPVGNSMVPSVQKAIDRVGVDLACTFAVGDHVNDIQMFDLVGYSIAINPKREELKQYVNYCIQTDNFLDVVNHIEKTLNK